MNNENDNPQRETSNTEMIDDLMIREPDKDEREKNVSSSVREIASRIPDSLSAIGREISHTIERAISAKDDYVVAVKLSPEAQEKIDQLTQAGLYKTRAEAAAFLIDSGIKGQAELFERVQQKLSEIERLRAELRGIVQEKNS